jgi:hypothetical protein
MTVRAYPFASAVLDSIQRVPAILLDGHTAIAAGTLTALSWIVGAANLRMLAVVTAAMLLDLALGSLWAALDPKTEWSAHRLYGGIAGKLVRLLAIPAASCADWLLLVAPFAGHPDPTAYAYPISAYVMWALAVAELVSALRTLVAAGVAPAALGTVIARLQASGPDLQIPKPAAPPAPAGAPGEGAEP